LEFISQPESPIDLGDVLLGELERSDPPWLSLTAAMAFVKRSGLALLKDALADFGAAGGHISFIVGVDHHGTSVEGLSLLLDSIGSHGTVVVFHSEGWTTFHPKLYLFERTDAATLVLGSGNLTAGGLHTNDEAGILISIDRTTSEGENFLQGTKSALARWQDDDSPLVRCLDRALLAQLEAEGYVVPEAASAPDAHDGVGIANKSPRKGLFGVAPARQARPRARRSAPTRAAAHSAVPWVGTNFAMTLQQTDAGTGQTTSGTSRRSPEIFIPLAARDEMPDFWGWRALFQEDPEHGGKFDRAGVKIRLGTQIVNVNIMTWPDRHDFRLRSEPLRSAGQVGDILRIERADGTQGFDYIAEIISQGTARHASQLRLCTRPVRNSKKRYGYY